MITKTRLALVSMLSLFLLVAAASSQDRQAGVQPAKLEAMQNAGLDLSKSGFPATLPREWGRLVSVQKTDNSGYTLFLQNDRDEIYLVRLLQRGQYLFLDTYDQGGVALVIRRTP